MGGHGFAFAEPLVGHRTGIPSFTGYTAGSSTVITDHPDYIDDNIFEYDFLDDQIAEFYRKEDLLNKLTTSAAVLAIVISCVGLLGLISLLTVQRTKEIGIRKVIGASVMSIILLFSNDFLKLIGLALLLATGVAWLVMNNWLEAFAYRITIPWWIFLLAGAGNVVLALATITYHALKVAMMNPVKSLRAE